ncbi:MAG: DMT family protein [Candidatus Wenzhouxiangella sp. M2_3B_020]
MTIARTIALLTLSNVFMTFAWYAHLKELNHKPWIVAALASWGIALFEYLLQVPANRIGYTVLPIAELKLLQEVITLSVFVPFALFYLKEPLKLDYLWAALCLVGAVYFAFRGHTG